MPTTRWLDFSAIKAAVSVRDVLARYGLADQLKEKGDGKLVGPCPIHGGTESGSTAFNADRSKFHCFSCGAKGNVLDLVMQLEDCSIRDAAGKLADWFKLGPFTRTREGPRDREPAAASDEPGDRIAVTDKGDDHEETVNPPLPHPLKDLNYDHPYLVERGLTVRTIKHFGVGHCRRGIMAGRIAIPIHNERGELVAYAGRAVSRELAEEKGKYRLPSNFEKSRVIWNLNRAKEHAERGLVVVEGFFDAMKVHQSGAQNVVALMGSTLSEHQEQLLVAHADRLVLMFDGDEAGTKCLREFYGKLRRKLYLREIHLEPSEQPDLLSEERIMELLGAKG